MKTTTVYTHRIAVALAAMLALAASPPCAANITGVALSLPDGYQAGIAVAANSSGQIVGQVMGEAGEAACLWRTDGTPVVLPAMEGYGSLHANAINDSGIVVGCCQQFLSPRSWRATRWTPAEDGSYTPENLGALDGQIDSEALGINAQGQILCSSMQNGGPPWFLWEDGVRTVIATVDGTPMYVEYKGLFRVGLLASDGRVAGTASVKLGMQDTSGNELYADEGFLWQKIGTEITVTQLTFPGTSGADGSADAISPGGMVTGYSSEMNSFFVYNANTGAFSYVDPTPWSVGSVIYTPYAIYNVNDQGQVSFLIYSYDESTATHSLVPWIWQTGTWTQVPLDALLLPSGPIQSAGVLNNNGQLAGIALYSDPITSEMMAIAFGWSASTGTQQLLPPQGVDSALAMAVGLSDSGLAVGAVSIFGYTDEFSPATWDMGTPANQPPTLTVPALVETVAGSPATFTASAIDPNPGDTLTFSLAAAPAGASIHPTTGVFAWIPMVPSTYTCSVTVTDSGGLSATQAVTLDVAPAISVGKASVAVKGKSVSVNVPLTNRSATAAKNVTLTSTNLGSVAGGSLKVGTIAAGETVQCTLTFKDVSAGNARLALEGSSSLGGFSSSQSLKVP